MSAFEEAIYRVYERCIENLRDDEDATMNSRTCKLLEYLSLGCGTLFLAILVTLHFSFVGQSGCLPELLQAELVRRNNTDLLPFDAILQINVDKYFVGDGNVAASTRRSMGDIDDESEDGSGRRSLRRLLGISSTPPPLLASSGGHLRFPRNLQEAKAKRVRTRSDKGLLVRTYLGLMRLLGSSSTSSSSSSSFSSSSSPLNGTTSWNSSLPLWPFNSTGANDTSIFDPLYYEVHDFEFSFDVGILELSGYLRQTHNFELINATMDGVRCLGSPFLQSLIPLGGIDIVVMNSIVATFKKAGMMIDSQGDYNLWHDRDVHPYSTPAEWLGFKINVLVKSLFLFFLLTTVTALLVRMLISSGVVLLFPIFWLVQYLGYGVISMRLISLSYPWIGVPLEMYNAQGQSGMPFLIGHMTRVIVYYTFYEATQFACSLWFYNQSQPGQRELWLFAILMLWEYYSMIYVRASASILLFPRASLALFLIYHFYLFCCPMGFHLLALLVLLFFLLWLMMYCVRKYEIPAFHRGFVNSDQPRQLYNFTPWPIWMHDLAPEFTVFMPTGRRSTSTYNMNVPPLPNGGAADAAAAAPSAAVAAAPSGPAELPVSLNPLQSQSHSHSQGRGGVEMREMPVSAPASSGPLASEPHGQPSSYQRLSDSSQH